jgi:hypothetical protein
MMNGIMAACAAISLACPATEQVPMGILASRVHEFAERPITVCGRVMDLSGHIPSEKYFWEGPGSHFSFLLDTSKLKDIAYGEPVCMTGIARRRDGLTVAESVEKGVGENWSPHGPQNGSFVFYPVAACPAVPQKPK